MANALNSPINGVPTVVDANGNLISDTLGLQSVMSNLGSYSNTAGGSGTGTGGMQALAATTLNFTLLRPVTVFVIGIISAVGVSGNSALVQIGMDGNFDFTRSMIGVAGDTKFNSVTLFGVWIGLAAGAHSCSLGIETVAGNSWSWDYTTIQAFQMGG